MSERPAETTEELAEQVRAAIYPRTDGLNELDSLLARLDAVTKEHDVLAVQLKREQRAADAESTALTIRYQAAEADAEALAQAAREFIGTTSASRQPTVSRHEFDQLCAALAARGHP